VAPDLSCLICVLALCDQALGTVVAIPCSSLLLLSLLTLSLLPAQLCPKPGSFYLPGLVREDLKILMY
jgi:hypothetical protein